MRTVTLELRWHQVLWAAQQGKAGALLLGEVPLKAAVREAVAKAAGEARLALAAEESDEGTEVVVAFDGSLLWPPLHASAEKVVLALSQDEPGAATSYDDEARGKLVATLVPRANAVAVGRGATWAEQVRPVIARVKDVEALALALALRGGLGRAGDERAAERAVHEALPDLPVLLSSDVAPLWGASDRPLEKAAVSACVLPLVREAAAGAREGLGDQTARVWFACLDGTSVPASLAERHPYAVLRGLPILSLTGALAYAREVGGSGPIAAGSMHETSTALARLGGRKGAESFDSALMGAHIESIGIGAESRIFLERGALTIADDRAPSGAVPLRALIAAAGLSDAAGGPQAAAVLGQWLSLTPESAVGRAFDTLCERLGARLRLGFGGAQAGVFAGPFAGALAGAAGLRAGLTEVFLPPAFGACAALVARHAPRAARGAETLNPPSEGLTLEMANRALEGLLTVGVGDLEEGGLDRDSLAAVTWVAGSKGAHGVFPVLDEEAVVKAAQALLDSAPKDGPVTIEVEVYPAAFDRQVQFPELGAPLAAHAQRAVILPKATKAIELRIVPSGALSEESPTRGPALLADPTGLILVPDGAVARPAPMKGTRITPA